MTNSFLNLFEDVGCPCRDYGSIFKKDLISQNSYSKLDPQKYPFPPHKIAYDKSLTTY